MSILKKWNDIIPLKIGDKISYKDVQYTIKDKSYDQDYGGADYTFTVTDDNNKTIQFKINVFGQISFNFADFKSSLPDSNLSENELKKISNGGMYKIKHKTKRNTIRRRKHRTKKTRRYYK